MKFRLEYWPRTLNKSLQNWSRSVTRSLSKTHSLITKKTNLKKSVSLSICVKARSRFKLMFTGPRKLRKISSTWLTERIWDSPYWGRESQTLILKGWPVWTNLQGDGLHSWEFIQFYLGVTRMSGISFSFSSLDIALSMTKDSLLWDKYQIQCEILSFITVRQVPSALPTN